MRYNLNCIEIKLIIILFRTEERLSSGRVAISTPVQCSRKRSYADTPKTLKTTRFCLPTPPTQSPSFLKTSHMVSKVFQIIIIYIHQVSFTG